MVFAMINRIHKINMATEVYRLQLLPKTDINVIDFYVAARIA